MKFAIIATAVICLAMAAGYYSAPSSSKPAPRSITSSGENNVNIPENNGVVVVNN